MCNERQCADHIQRLRFAPFQWLFLAMDASKSGYGVPVIDGNEGGTRCAISGERLSTKPEIGHGGRVGKGGSPVAEDRLLDHERYCFLVQLGTRAIVHLVRSTNDSDTR